MLVLAPCKMRQWLIRFLTPSCAMTYAYHKTYHQIHVEKHNLYTITSIINHYYDIAKKGQPQDLQMLDAICEMPSLHIHSEPSSITLHSSISIIKWSPRFICSPPLCRTTNLAPPRSSSSSSLSLSSSSSSSYPSPASF